MALLLNQTADQFCTLINHLYSGFSSGYIAPSGLDNLSTSCYKVYSPNQNPALYVANTYTAFANNLLKFNLTSCDTFICLYDNKGFGVTDNVSTYFYTSGSQLKFGTPTNKNQFVVNDGKVGIGTGLPSSNLEIIADCTDSICQKIYNTNTGVSGNKGSALQLIANYSGIDRCFVLETKANQGTNSYNYIGSSGANAVPNLYIDSYNHLFRTSDCKNKFVLYANIDSNLNYAVNYGCSFRQEGSGDLVGIELANNKKNACHSINFYNSSGGIHSSIKSQQSSTQSNGSQLRFSVTQTGNYDSIDRTETVLVLDQNKKANFYGNICAPTGFFSGLQISDKIFTNYLQVNQGLEIHGNKFCNLTCKTQFNCDVFGWHLFLTNSTIAEPNNYAYGFQQSASGYALCHVFYNSGIKSMEITTGIFTSYLPTCISGNLNVYSTGFDTSIYSKDIYLNSDNLYIESNIINSGYLITTGSISAFSLVSTGANVNNIINSCLTVSGNTYLKSTCLTNLTGATAVITDYANISTLNVNQNATISGAICQKGTALNCFSSNLNIGTSCSGEIQSINTAKGWGVFHISGGRPLSYSGYCFAGVSLVSATAGNRYATYELNFKQAIKYPFSISYSYNAAQFSALTSTNYYSSICAINDIISINCGRLIGSPGSLSPLINGNYYTSILFSPRYSVNTSTAMSPVYASGNAAATCLNFTGSYTIFGY